MIINVVPMSVSAVRQDAAPRGAVAQAAESDKLLNQGGGKTVDVATLTGQTPAVRPQKQDVYGAEEKSKATANEIEQKAEKANAYFQESGTQLAFKVSEQTGRIIVHVIDSETGEIVREIPPDTLNRFSDRVTQIKGLLFEAQG
jgi:flagellar protein FlaG